MGENCSNSDSLIFRSQQCLQWKQIKWANAWLSSFKIPTMEDDIREDEEWCYQCRYICCDTIFRQKWKFDRHISSWWERQKQLKTKLKSHISAMACWSASSTNKTSKLISEQVPLFSCCVMFCYAVCPFQYQFKTFQLLLCSILRASPGYYLRKTYHSCR